MCEAYYREKAGLSSGGSGLKYPMWNVERSSLSTDKAKNMQWSVTLVHQVFRRFLWLNVLWTVQGLDLEGIRIDSAGVGNLSLKWAVVFKCKQQQDHPCYHWRGEQAQSPRQIRAHFPGSFCASLSFSHLTGQGWLLWRVKLQFLEHELLLCTSEKERTLLWLTSALKSCLAKDSFCHLCHREEKFLGVPPSSQLLPAAGAVQLAYTGAEGYFFFFFNLSHLICR